MRTPLVYQDRPIFGFDLGTATAKMLQLRPAGHGWRVAGYGYADFPAEAIVEGIIVDPDEIAAALKPLLAQMSYGRITATRVAASLPTAKVFTRQLELPTMNEADLDQAVRFEAEQYIPVPLADLYIDYETAASTAETSQILMAAAPRAIVDSYINLFDRLGLEVAAVESSLAAVTRAIVTGQPLSGATMVADFGAPSFDLTVYDGAIRLTDTIAVGGDDLTRALVDKLGLTERRAIDIKRKFGLKPSDLRPKILSAIQPSLTTIISEIKRVAKYYDERSSNKHPLERLLVVGGSAAMPGLIEYLGEQLGMSVELGNPWLGLELKGVQSVSRADAPLYATAIGLARLESHR